MTQEHVADAISLSRAMVAQIETGVRPANTVLLEKIASVFRCDVRDFFVATASTDAVGALFRATEAIQEEVAEETLKPQIALLRQYTALEKMLGVNPSMNSPVRYETAEMKSNWDAIQAGVKIAEDERRRLQLGIDPMSDMAGLLELQGVRVLGVDLPDTISGAFLGDDQTGLAVLFNRKHHEARHAFTLAHEYCHVLADRDKLSVVSAKQNQMDLIEVRANAFAAALLLPEDGVKAFFDRLGKAGPTRSALAVADSAEGVSDSSERRRSAEAVKIQIYDIAHLQFHYGVSWETAVYRLHNLRYIGKDERDDLLSKKAQANFLENLMRHERGRKGSGGKEIRDFSSRFFGVAMDAYRQEFISRAKLDELMEMINVSSVELKSILNETRRGRHPGGR
jgi:Zn-dependent peptidase ImmA (M78 family)/DNA-binding XRE family transcriptional regulator